MGGRGIVILIVCALPATSNILWRQLERGHALQDPSDAPTAEAIVVLSGMLRAVPSGDGFAYEWSEAADRYFAGVDLALAMKAPKLIFTRGAQPWSAGAPEGEVLFDARQAGPRAGGHARLTPPVENTAQEAQAVAEMLSPKAEGSPRHERLPHAARRGPLPGGRIGGDPLARRFSRECK